MYYVLTAIVFSLLGYFVSRFIFSLRTFKVQGQLMQQERQIKQLVEDFQRKEKDLNLEIMARDKKISSAQKKYETLQAEIAHVQESLDESRQEQDKLYFALREEYEIVSNQLKLQQQQYENLLADREQKIVSLQAEHDNVKLKWEHSLQDHAVKVLKSDLRLREQEIENLKREISTLSEKNTK
jgi:chromosome segregation ATPase